ncbi:hypothetical protein SGRIM119S_03447 [Streptomyces griseorubiginosus]
MRPKSIATVVCVFSGSPCRSSMPTLSCVIGSSVRSGSISETLATKVVFPTPKCPETRSFTVRVTVVGR